MGHVCRICGRSRPNERFSGSGHRSHVCCDCALIPAAERDAIEEEDEILGFLDQSHISSQNLARLRELSASQSSRVSELAALVHAIALVAPFKRRRLARLRSSRTGIWARMVAHGLADLYADELEGSNARIHPAGGFDHGDDE